jgi:hypothetical protein
MCVRLFQAPALVGKLLQVGVLLFQKRVEFVGFWREVIVLENNEFWKYYLHCVVLSMHLCISFD